MQRDLGNHDPNLGLNLGLGQRAKNLCIRQIIGADYMGAGGHGHPQKHFCGGRAPTEV